VSARDIEREAAREEKTSRMSRMYERFMRAFLNQSWLAIPAVLLLLLGAYLVYGQLGSGFMPEMDEGSFVIDYSSPPGTSLTETNRMLMNVERALMKVPEVDAYSRRTGTQLGFFLTEPNRGDYTVRLKKLRTRPIDEVINDVRQRVQQIEPRLTVDFGQILQDVIGDLTNTPSPVEVKIFGGNQAAIEKEANHVLALISPVKGVVDGFNGIVIAGPSNLIEVDPQRSSFYGITTKDVQEQLELMMQGLEATSVLIDQKTIGVRVRFPSAYHFDLDSLESLLLTNPKGTLVPLKEIATIRRTPGEAERDREGLEPFIAVTARIENRDLGSTINEIKSVLGTKLHLPRGMRIEYGGVYETQQESFRSLLMVALVAFVLVFLVLLLAFREFRAAIAIILITILSLGGVFAALLVTNMTLNISSFVGLIMIIGIVAENAIFIIYTAHLPRYRALHPHEAIIGATRERVRPIAMTTLAAVLALLPLALALGAGAQMQQSLAIAVIGGFSVSTILLFVLLPALYTLLSPRGKIVADTELTTTEISDARKY
jgi:multidrug efflux pump subunit AcrB